MDLSKDEARALVRALDGYLPVLEFTLSRVKHPKDRHDLVLEDELLRGLRERLARQGEPAAASGAAR